MKEVLDAEQAGNMNPTLRLKKKALQQAYDQAIKKKMVRKKKPHGPCSMMCIL